MENSKVDYIEIGYRSIELKIIKESFITRRLIQLKKYHLIQKKN